MNAPTPTPFRVLQSPYVVWSHDLRSDNQSFLDRIDSDFYNRTAHSIFFDSDGKTKFPLEDDDARKDVASLARLLWNHGLETLVTLLGAYVQAPHAVHAFFLKCQNSDCRHIARGLLSGKLPEDNCLSGDNYSIERLVNGLHLHSTFRSNLALMRNYTRVLENILHQYDQDDHRAEYNSIKHGLRASHGRFALAVGLQDAPGIQAPDDRMEMIFDSQDSSHFFLIQEFPHLTKKQTRQNFAIEHGAVAWSLEKTIMEIQLTSLLIGSIIAALKICNGMKANTVKFSKPIDDSEFWAAYFDMHDADIHNFKFGGIVDMPNKIGDAEKLANNFYKNAKRKRLGCGESDGGKDNDL